MREHLVLCGAAKLTSRQKIWQDADQLRLDAGRKEGNVNLRISDITGRMASSLPAVASDLVELATYVYCADQAIRRGSEVEFEYGAKWRRHFRFEVAVRCPQIWSDARVVDALKKTLGFLSDDDYEFGFSKLANPPPFADYLEFDKKTAQITDVKEVVLFSGGIDSLGGAIEEVLIQRRKVALVSHRPVSTISKRQRQLVELIAGRTNDKKLAPFHVPVLVNKDKELGRDYTQRTRSFLYASIAAVVARLYELSRIRFYENGVVSLNMPICAAVLGGRATRTTHPQVIRGFEDLFSLLLGTPFAVENPFLWKTKTDVIAGIKAAGHADLCKYAVSCTRTWEMTKLHTHCGKCSQCIDRRLAALSAGLTDNEDPPEMYAGDVMKDGHDEPRFQTLIERMVGAANEIERMHDATQFGIRFGELSRVLRYIEGKADDVASRVFELHKRHAQQVCKAIDEFGTAMIPEMRRGTLSANCLTSIALGRSPKFRDFLGEGATKRTSTMPQFTPTPDDLRILRELERSATTMTLVAIEAATSISRKTVGKRVSVFRRHALVDQPHNRKGITLSDSGRAFLKQLTKQSCDAKADPSK